MKNCIIFCAAGFTGLVQSIEEGDLVIALSEGKNNLKKLALDPERQRYILRSCNPDREAYPDIETGQLEIQGVAVGVFHRFAEAE